MQYKKQYVPGAAAGRRPGLPMTPEYLTVHSTGNPQSTAQNEADNLCNNAPNTQVSFHLVVDGYQAVEVIPFDEVAWHAGDGGSGTGNRKSIGMEICESGDRAQTLRNAIIMAADILINYGWDTSRLKRHYDWTGKNCPRILIDPAYRREAHQTWDWFVGEVQKEMGPKELTEVNDIVWELGHRGIVTDKQGMLDEISKDPNGRLYWLARKTANMTVNK